MVRGLVEDDFQTDDITRARCVVLSDGRAGHQSQSVGVAEMLGVRDPEVITLNRKGAGTWAEKLWGLLPPAWSIEHYETFLTEMRRTEVALGTGWRISEVLRDLKRRNPALFTICMMKPSGAVADYDVVAIPQHDKDSVADAPNVVVTLGAPNRITRERLALETDRWRKRLGHIKGFRLAVMVGGNSKHGAFGPSEAKVLVDAMAEAVKDRDGGLLVTTSRRTGAPATEALRRALEESGIPFYFWMPDDPTARDNPYHAYLGLADAVVVTAESISMASEAATAGKPVYLWGRPEGVAPKFRSMYAAFIKQGRAKWWDGALNLRPPAAGLLDTLMVAGFIRARWLKRNKA